MTPEIAPDPNSKVLWGRKAGAEEWQNEVLSTNEAVFDRVKILAARDGFSHFRIATLGGLPDFSKVLNTGKRRAKA